MKTVLITGCSSGLGLAMVPAFLKNDWQVIASVKTMEDCPKEFKELQQNFQLNQENRFHILKLDLEKSEDIDNVPKLLANNYQNQLDCLVNNAGSLLAGPLEKLTEDQIRKQMEINFFGTVFLIQSCLPLLRFSQGKIINISSVLGFSGLPLTSIYCASKFAIEGFTESLYYELNPFGIQVALVEPGIHRTNIFKKINFGKRKVLDLNNHNHKGIELAKKIYETQEKNLIFYKDKIQDSRFLNPPEKVANTVVKLANKKKMPLRTRVGLDSNGLYFLNRLLPKQWVYFILKLLYNKLYIGDLLKNKKI